MHQDEAEVKFKISATNSYVENRKKMEKNKNEQITDLSDRMNLFHFVSIAENIITKEFSEDTGPLMFSFCETSLWFPIGFHGNEYIILFFLA